MHDGVPFLLPTGNADGHYEFLGQPPDSTTVLQAGPSTVDEH